MKFKISEVKQIIKEEVERIQKIEQLNERKKLIEKELGTLLNEFTVVAPGDKKTLKDLTTNGKHYLESLAKLLKKYPESKMQGLIQKFAVIQQQVEAELSGIALKGEGKPESPAQTAKPGTPKATVKPVQIPAGVPASIAGTAGGAQEVEEGIGLSLTNRQGQNLKPNTAHKKVRSGLKENQKVDEGNFLKRGLNKVGHTLSFGDRTTDKGAYSWNQQYENLNSKNLKWLINYFNGKNNIYKPGGADSASYLKKIIDDLKLIIDKDSFPPAKNIGLIKNAYDQLNNARSQPSIYLPPYKEGDKNQYRAVKDVLKNLYDLTYNEAN